MSMAVVYTDLDGTLLDHYTYAFDEALETIKSLRARGIPIVPCTSKTRAETVSLMQDLELDGPMIIENGAAIWVPDAWGLIRPEGADDDVNARAWSHCFGPPRGMIRRQLAILNIEWGNRYQSLCELSDKQVMAITGLDAASAARANSSKVGFVLRSSYTLLYALARSASSALSCRAAFTTAALRGTGI